MTVDGVTTLVEHGGWKVRRFDCPEDDRPDYRHQYLIERTDGKIWGGWLSDKDYKILKEILKMADMTESGVKE